VPGSNDHFFTYLGTTVNPCDAAIYEWKIISSVYVGTNIIREQGFNFLTDDGTQNVPGYVGTSGNYVRWAVSIPNATDMYAVGLSDMGGYGGAVGMIKYKLGSGIITTVKRRMKCSYNNEVPFFLWGGTTVENTPVDKIQIGEYHPLLTNGMTHADVRGMVLRNPSSGNGVGDELFVATDGGVSKKKAGEDLTALTTAGLGTYDFSGSGLECGTIWGVALSEDGGLLMGGAQHDGIYSYEPSQTDPWHVSSGLYICSDGKNGYFNKVGGTNLTDAYCITNFSGDATLASVPGGGREIDTWGLGTAPFSGSTNGIWDWFSDEENHFAGRQYLYKRTGGTGNWGNSSVGYGLPVGSDIINRMAFVTNTDGQSPVGYLCYNGDMGLRYKQSGQPNFTNVTADLPQPTNHLPVNAITLDEDHPERVWVAMGGISPVSDGDANYKVFYSDDWGTTWHDVSVGLPNQLPVTAIVHRQGTNEV
jgi:hypothetical protein